MIKETGYTILTQILGLVLGIGTSIVLNRILGPAGKGEFVILFLVPQLIVAFTNLGMGTSASYFIGKKIYNENKVIINTFIFSIVVGGLGMFVGHYFLGASGKGFQALTELPLHLEFMVLSMVILGLWANFTGEFFMGKGKIGLYNLWNLLQIGGRLFILVGFLYFFTNKLYGAITGIVFLNIILFLFSFFMLYKTRRDTDGNAEGHGWKHRETRIDVKYFKDSIKFGYKVFILESLGFLVFRFDNFLLKIFTNDAQIGYYSTAVYMIETLWLIPRAVYYVLYSKAVTGKADVELTTRFIRLSLWITIILGCLSILIVRPIIMLFYGKDFLPSFEPYIILLPGIISFTIPWILGAQIIGGWGRPEILIPGRIGAVLLNIVLNLFFIPKWGMNGAALASTITYLSEASYYTIIYRRKVKKSIREILIIKKEDIRALHRKQYANAN